MRAFTNNALITLPETPSDWANYLGWLEAALDHRGLDGPLYARCILKTLKDQKQVDAAACPFTEDVHENVAEILSSYDKEKNDIGDFVSIIVQRFRELAVTGGIVPAERITRVGRHNDSLDSGVCPSPDDYSLQNYDEAFPPLGDDFDGMQPNQSQPHNLTNQHPAHSATQPITINTQLAINVLTHMPRSFDPAMLAPATCGSAPFTRFWVTSSDNTSRCESVTAQPCEPNGSDQVSEPQETVEKSAPRFILPFAHGENKRVCSLSTSYEYGWSAPTTAAVANQRAALGCSLDDTQSEGEGESALTLEDVGGVKHKNVTTQPLNPPPTTPHFVLPNVNTKKNKLPLGHSLPAAPCAMFTGNQPVDHEFDFVPGDDQPEFCMPLVCDQELNADWLYANCDQSDTGDCYLPDEETHAGAGVVPISANTHFAPIRDKNELNQTETGHFALYETSDADYDNNVSYVRGEQYYVLRDTNMHELNGVSVCDSSVLHSSTSTGSLRLKFKAANPQKQVQTAQNEQPQAEWTQTQNPVMCYSNPIEQELCYSNPIERELCADWSPDTSSSLPTFECVTQTIPIVPESQQPEPATLANSCTGSVGGVWASSRADDWLLAGYGTQQPISKPPGLTLNALSIDDQQQELEDDQLLSFVGNISVLAPLTSADCQ